MKLAQTLAASIILAAVPAVGGMAKAAGLFSGPAGIGWAAPNPVADQVQYRGCYDAFGHGPYPCGPNAPYRSAHEAPFQNSGPSGHRRGYRGGRGCYDAYGHGPYPCGPNAPYASAYEAPYQSSGRPGKYGRGW